MKKRFAAAGLAAGLTGGAIAGIALTHPSISGAQTDTTAPSTTVPDTTAPGTTDRDRARPAQARPRPVGRRRARAARRERHDHPVASGCGDRRDRSGSSPSGGPGFGHGFGHGALISMPRPPRSASPRTSCGPHCSRVSPSPRSRRRTASTAQTVIDALVADAKTHIAERVTSGDITQAEADQKVADADRAHHRDGERRAARCRGPGGPADDSDDELHVHTTASDARPPERMAPLPPALGPIPRSVDGRRDPHPARRARRAVAAASGVAFAGVGRRDGDQRSHIVGCHRSGDDNDRRRDPNPFRRDTRPPLSPTWSVTPVPSTVPQRVTRVPHTQKPWQLRSASP